MSGCRSLSWGSGAFYSPPSGEISRQRQGSHSQSLAILHLSLCKPHACISVRFPCTQPRKRCIPLVRVIVGSHKTISKSERLPSFSRGFRSRRTSRIWYPGPGYAYYNNTVCPSRISPNPVSHHQHILTASQTLPHLCRQRILRRPLSRSSGDHTDFSASFLPFPVEEPRTYCPVCLLIFALKKIISVVQL